MMISTGQLYPSHFGMLPLIQLGERIYFPAVSCESHGHIAKRPAYQTRTRVLFKKLSCSFPDISWSLGSLVCSHSVHHGFKIDEQLRGAFLVCAAFPQLPETLTADTLWPAFNAIRRPSLIRVEADEAQYPMHIILRCVTGFLADGVFCCSCLKKPLSLNFFHF